MMNWCCAWLVLFLAGQNSSTVPYLYSSGPPGGLTPADMQFVCVLPSCLGVLAEPLIFLIQTRVDQLN
jgi:hypothetical protein